MKNICGVELYKDKYLIDYKNRLLEILEIKENSFIYKIHQFWDKTESELLEMDFETFEEFLNQYKEHFDYFTSLGGQDIKTYSYIFDKTYLKWNDLKFEEDVHYITDAKLNEKLYIIEHYVDYIGYERVEIYEYDNGEKGNPCAAIGSVTFFNNLHFEVVK